MIILEINIKRNIKNRLEVKFENGIYTLLLGIPNDLIPTTISLQTNDPQEFLDFIYEELRTRNYMDLFLSGKKKRYQVDKIWNIAKKNRT